MNHSHVLILPAIALLFLAGCGKSEEAVPPVQIAPGAAGAAAVEQLDKDGDAKLSRDEIQQAPSIAASIKYIDANNDGQVVADEISARIEKWKETQIGLMSLNCQVQLDGKPLADAKVLLEPEQFLIDDLLHAEGRTNASGVAVLRMIDADGKPHSSPGMVRPGYYKVRITHDRHRLPARYNSATTLGVEVAPDRPASAIAAFSLQSAE
jgi:hypothetical protein